ncbi:MAG: hypothetical protein NVS4B3_06830 [Gemmatimonadaceae bacterium]
MRVLPWSIVFLAACGGSESRTATTTTDSAGGTVPRATASTPTGTGKYSGTWIGRSYRSPKDTGVAWTNVITVGADGKLQESLTFTGAKGPPVTSRGTVTDSGFTSEMGPYMSPSAKTEVTTTIHGQVAGDSMSGTYEARPTKGGAAIHGTFAAKRTGPATP